METSELNVIYQGLEGKVFSEKINKQICKLIDNNNLERNTDILPEIAVAILKETVNEEDFIKAKEIIGYIGAHKKYGSMAHIDILVIDTKQREKGLGTMLIKHMCSTLLELGYTSFSSEVAADNVDVFYAGIVTFQNASAPLRRSESCVHPHH